MAFYKVVLNGVCMGQDIRNILYYRSGAGLDVSGMVMAGAEALAGNINQELVPTFLAASSDNYMLESIDVYPISEGFQLLYQMPYSLAVGLNGQAAGSIPGPAVCINFKFMLEATSIINGVKPPSRGYMAFGPVNTNVIGEDGFLLPGVLGAGGQFMNLAEKLSQNIEQLVPVPASWYPIRLKQNRLLGGLIQWESYADIKGCLISRRVSFRRSRMPEA